MALGAARPNRWTFEPLLVALPFLAVGVAVIVTILIGEFSLDPALVVLGVVLIAAVTGSLFIWRQRLPPHPRMR